jgi:hypothetical protein
VTWRSRFHWEYQENALSGRLPGKRAAWPLAWPRPDQRQQERGAQAAGRRDADRGALPLHERARDRGRRGDGRGAARPRRGRRPPAPNTYEVAAGDVEWLFVPLEAAAKMRASFILLGPLLRAFGG